MNLPFLRPTLCPAGIDPAVWRKAVAERIDRHAAILSNLIDALDAMESDADFEPWLGAQEVTSGSIEQTHWAAANGADREEENEHGGDVQDEPHDDIDEGNTDFSCEDDMRIYSQMSEGDRDAVDDECERLLAKAYGQLPPPVVLQFSSSRT